MKVLVAGGTGFVGHALIKQLLNDGIEVLVLTRNPNNVPFKEEVTVIQWGVDFTLQPSEHLQDVDYIVNLAGESIGSGRWTNAKKERILSSRVKTTRGIVQGIENGIIQPKAFINASAVGFYGPRYDEVITEIDSHGKDFLSKVSKAWEDEANQAAELGVRVVTLRIGVVLGNGGALKQMVLPFKFYVGGTIGDGEQWFPWIHIDDLVRIIKYVMEHQAFSGPVNAVAPKPIRMRDFHQQLGKVLHKPSWFPIPVFLLQMLLGEKADMLIHGQRVIPKKLKDVEFEFQFSDVYHALESILKKK